MIGEFCQIKHDPANGQYGDCLRACVASILELDSADVPHFAENGGTMQDALYRARLWLSERSLTLFCTLWEDEALSDVLQSMGNLNSDVHYILYGDQPDGGSHVVVCRGDKIAHNPAWAGGTLVRPSAGFWLIMVIARA